VIHDLFEDAKCTSFDEILSLDDDGREVLALVMEETRKKTESKDDYLKRLLTDGSERAKILKCADRISNLTDLHPDIFDKEFIKNYINETKKWVVPMARQVNKDMLFELEDLIKRRETNMKFSSSIWPLKRKEGD
jgi:GTP pyrophosphokinase